MEESTEDDRVYDQRMAEIERAKILQIHENMGYKAGMEEGEAQEEALQAGFNDGFKESRAEGLRVGRDLAIARVRRKLPER